MVVSSFETHFIAEIVYTLITIILCLIAYFKTKEIYDLTKHKGIGYFRTAFLFFGFSYIVRFLLGLLFFSRTYFDIDISRRLLFPASLFIVGYLSTIAISYLILSTIWNKISNKGITLIIHLAAILLSLISLLMRSPLVMLSMQMILMITTISISYNIHKKQKKPSKTTLLYTLVSISWFVNLLVVTPGRFLPIWLHISFQAISLVVLAVIIIKISKWIK